MRLHIRRSIPNNRHATILSILLLDAPAFTHLLSIIACGVEIYYITYHSATTEKCQNIIPIYFQFCRFHLHNIPAFSICTCWVQNFHLFSRNTNNKDNGR